MKLIGRDEMQGFLETLDNNPSTYRGLTRIKAVMDHFFTCQVFSQIAKEVGYRYSENLMDFIRMAVLTDKSNEALVFTQERKEKP
jgi:hypothetical protein